MKELINIIASSISLNVRTLFLRLHIEWVALLYNITLKWK